MATWYRLKSVLVPIGYAKALMCILKKAKSRGGLLREKYTFYKREKVVTLKQVAGVTCYCVRIAKRIPSKLHF